MTDSLYVCHFSNGHIKVGRSIEPTARIAAHADRVACVGIELVEHHIAECDSMSVLRERMLIERCAANASQRNKSEWFVGLDYLDACAWADEFAACTLSHLEVPAVADAPDAAGRIGVMIQNIINHGLSQSEIARRTGIPQPRVSRWLKDGSQAANDVLALLEFERRMEAGRLA